MKPIVLATDGSPSAAKATLEAIELARALDTRLIAVSVEHVTLPSAGYYHGYSDVPTELGKMEYDRTHDALVQARAVAADAEMSCEAVHAKGLIANEICWVATTHHARMIVIGAHGWGAIRRAFHGSVSTAVVQQAPCAVLVVRDEQDHARDGVALEWTAGMS
jgi:nucleotide-binding universal stress UspA family protein